MAVRPMLRRPERWNGCFASWALGIEKCKEAGGKKKRQAGCPERGLVLFNLQSSNFQFEIQNQK
jgi:hypothetical protein